ncbi:MAG: hypothetical protein AAFQ22_06270 [Pseudomonadota bacterium]
MDRTSLMVLVAGAHASLLGVVAWRVVPLVVGHDTDAKTIALVPQDPQPIADLPELETFYDVPLRQVRQAQVSTAALPAPDAYPQFRNLAASMRLVTATETPEISPPPASEKPAVILARASEADVQEAFPPLPDAATQEALRNMLCDGMSASEDAACMATPQPRYVSADVDIESADIEELSFYSSDSWKSVNSGATQRATSNGYVVRTVFAGRDVSERRMQPAARVTPARFERRAEAPAPIVYR